MAVNRCAEVAERVRELYEAASSGDRLGLLPLLTQIEIDQLSQLQIPTWDGNVLSKSTRNNLWQKGLIDRWNGYQIVNIYGFAVLETLGLIRKEFRG